MNIFFSFLCRIENLIQQFRELKDAKKILHTRSTVLHAALLKNNLSDYCESTFYLASKELDTLCSIINIKNYRYFIVIGCGATSETLIYFSLKYPSFFCTGMDTNKTVIKNACLIKKKFGLHNIQYFLSHGSTYAFSAYSKNAIIVITLCVTQKYDVLCNVISSVKKGTLVIIREPLGASKLFFETSNYTAFSDVILLKKQFSFKENVKTIFLLKK